LRTSSPTGSLRCDGSLEPQLSEYLGKYSVETKGVYIQDVVLPEALVEVLSARELAVQQRQTFAREQEAQSARIDVEKAKGTADAQQVLARAQVDVEVQKNTAAARTAEAEGEANFTRMTGEAEAAKTQAIGVAEARAIEAQGLARAVGYRGTDPTRSAPARPRSSPSRKR
jgi:regulator of protease activity HflC (stomatin/prohibitin superfamily)